MLTRLYSALESLCLRSLNCIEIGKTRSTHFVQSYLTKAKLEREGHLDTPLEYHHAVDPGKIKLRKYRYFLCAHAKLNPLYPCLLCCCAQTLHKISMHEREYERKNR
jgi:hypothetical protein